MKHNIFFMGFIILLAACSTNRAENRQHDEIKKGKLVYALTTVQQGSLASVIKLPAQLAAYQEVSIFPRVNGYVKSVQVDIGSKVTAGTLLMLLEAPELAQAALQAREKYARSKADYSIDKEHYLRLLEASATSGAISPLELSTIKAKMEADSAVSNAEKANWQMQQTMLGYLEVRAPFAGIITERNVHPGALVSAAEKTKPMLELKQTAHLRLQVDIPETIAGYLKQKDTISFYVSAFPGKKMTGLIIRRSNNINSAFRSERMEIDIANKEGLLSPGMFADVTVFPKGNGKTLFVPRTAVVTSTERKYVLLVKNGKIKKVDVSTGSETGTSTEIYGTVQAGDSLIAVANDEIKEGSL